MYSCHLEACQQVLSNGVDINHLCSRGFPVVTRAQERVLQTCGLNVESQFEDLSTWYVFIVETNHAVNREKSIVVSPNTPDEVLCLLDLGLTRATVDTIHSRRDC